MINKLKYSINAFKTKQVLDKSYQKYTKDFVYKDWSGEYNKEFDLNFIKKLIDKFDNDLKGSFDLIHNNDYRYVYKSKNITPAVYIKEYRTWEASYSKFTIIKRNIIRRTLAKKAFALGFKLEELKIPVIKSIFYARKGKRYIPNISIYVSLAEEDAIPISYYFEELYNKKDKNDFTNKFHNIVKIVNKDKLEEKYKKIIDKILENGIRSTRGELLSNLLIKYTKNDFNLIMCDLDIINAFLIHNKKEKEKEFNFLLNNFQLLSQGKI
jgi:hypothetical protein